MNARKHLTLFELNSLVHDVIETTLTNSYWVEAELSDAHEVRGHFYMELVQKDPSSATPLARAKANCWRTTWNRLRPRFEKATGQTLHAGMTVLLQVTANFHEAYGFSWNVQDIDPTYTLGDMARKRMEIISRLKEEGVFDLQKQLAIPMFAQRLAVISSGTAAGYGDFTNQLADNDHGFCFHAELFPAIMQGQQVEQSVIAALNAINERADEFDVVVIIRGGGATADMSGFDTLALAENVANFPLPIITGIGHERDESILDMVSNTRVNTPTAAATLLVERLTSVWNHIGDLEQSIATSVSRRMDTERARLSSLAVRIPTLFSLVKTRQEARLDRMAARMQSLISERLARASQHINILASNIMPISERHLTQERSRLEQLSLRLKALDPALLLKRGYSITLFNGRAIRDATQLKPGDEITTRLQHGSVKSQVK